MFGILVFSILVSVVDGGGCYVSLLDLFVIDLSIKGKSVNNSCPRFHRTGVSYFVSGLLSSGVGIEKTCKSFRPFCVGCRGLLLS